MNTGGEYAGVVTTSARRGSEKRISLVNISCCVSPSFALLAFLNHAAAARGAL